MKLNKRILTAAAALLLFHAPCLSGASGERVRLTGVRFEGNSVFKNSALRRSIITGRPALFRRRHYYRRIAVRDAELIKELYISRGYLAAGVTLSELPGKSGKSIEAVFTIEEGDPYTISEVIFLGNDFYGDRELEAVLGFGEGDVFTRKRIDQAAANLIALYSNNGFSDAEISSDLRVSHEPGTVSCDIMIREGERHRVSDIIIRGTEKTRDAVILREVTFAGGELVDYSRLLETRTRLYSTGLFRSVFLRPAPTDDGRGDMRDIVIDLREQMSVELGVSAGYDTVEYFWQRLELENRNLGGSGMKFGADARRSSVSDSLSVTFTEPRSFGTPWRTELSVYAGRRAEPSYGISETAFNFQMGRNFSEKLTLHLTYSYKLSSLDDIDPEQFKGKSRTTGNIISAGAVYDTRDSIFYATEGMYIELKNEFISSTDFFFRTSLSLRKFMALTGSLSAGSSVSAGIIPGNIPLLRLSPDERFYTGGPYSVRGFGYNILGPSDSPGKPSGGKFKLVVNVIELRQRIYKRLSSAVFFDAGNIWREISDAEILSLKTSAGAGIRADLPIGVFRFDYAINLRPTEDEPSSGYFFGAGMAF